MKWTIILLLGVLTANLSFSQSNLSENEKLSSLCKVWGFLKYYHPKVAKGKIDWDKELINHIPQVLAANNRHELNVIYYDWLKKLGKVKKYKKLPDDITQVKINFSMNWIYDIHVFEDSLASSLFFIEKYRNMRRNFYVQTYALVENTVYKNENPYDGKLYIYPPVEYRLLGLFRYWNIINYFYPYKYIIGTDWNNVLDEMIPKFKDALDTIPYHLAMLELVGKINDSHGTFATKYTNKYFGLYWAPFEFKLIDGKAVVTGFYNDTLCRLDDIKIGDVIFKVNNDSVKDIIKNNSKYIPASNEPTRLRNFSHVIFNGPSDNAIIVFDRDDKIMTKTIHRYLPKQLHYKPPVKPVCKILENKIGYVNMGVLEKKQVDSVMNQMLGMDAIIFDIRNYPKGTLYLLSVYLNKTPMPFVKVLTPELNYPGVYRKSNPLYCGTVNDNYYRGKVIILFDETTQSHAEFTCMALQTAPNVKSIGSQTAGADGNVSQITFPGGFNTHMTGIGIFYPDGRPTQRIGIVPDIEVKPTIEGIKEGIDEVLLRAISYARTGK